MKVAILINRADPTNASLFRKLNKEEGMGLVVYYCSDIGVGKADYDDQFNKSLKFAESDDLGGYKHKFLPNFLPLQFSASRGFWLNPTIIFELIKNRYDAFVVFGWNAPTFWLVFLTSFFLKMPVILSGESPLKHEVQKRSFGHRVKKLLLRWLFRRVAAFLYIGEENKKFYKHYDVPDEKLFFAPYAVDNERFMKATEELRPKRDEIRKKLGIKKDDVVILFVGKLIPKKRPKDLLKSFKLLITNYKLRITPHLIFVGEGKLYPELEKYVKDNSIKNVHFIGFKNKTELPRYYVLADIFVLPSGIGETWGLVVNEAMCYGLPVIVSNLVGSGPDLVKEGENGYKFSVDDVNALTEKLEVLIKDESKRKEFGKKSFEIIQNYSHEKDIEGILSALNSL